MPSPSQSTFDGNPNTSPPTTTPYRPGLDDFDGAQCIDDPSEPVETNDMPRSSCWNTFGYMLVSACKMIAVANISVTAGVSPTTAFWNTAANNIAANPFTITRNSVGNYSLTFTAGTFPAPTSAARAFLNVLLGAHNYSIGCVNIANGVQVTTTQDGALTDLNFTVDLF
jgi:hypothetical protein